MLWLSLPMMFNVAASSNSSSMPNDFKTSASACFFASATGMFFSFARCIARLCDKCVKMLILTCVRSFKSASAYKVAFSLALSPVMALR